MQQKKPSTNKAKKPVKRSVNQREVIGKTTDRSRDRPIKEMPQKPRKTRQEQTKKEEKKKRNTLLYVIIVVLVVIIAILLFRACQNKDKAKAEYEDTVSMSYEPNADIEVDETRLNLAIMPDYVVTKSKPNMLVPYPEQNAYDIDLTFCDPMTDEILYQSKLIAPGSIISVPAYNFVDDGTYPYRVEVRAFDRTTHELVDESVAMEAYITKK